ncbi:MAG: succinate dehydrogenase, cytochrome b556 subunit [Gammaproteobacteria bacterium RIFCSPHIGHO2_12_FULL_42_13]|nr:MAG: succinate dehydrogenase, cytochrome b556 subunit [Gammaproteobacteria bacterium RIFCSPHIGHO2_12_FULL_42_13]
MIIHRPKNLNLFTIHFPLPAIVSILHRVSGFALFILIPVVIWIWSLSIGSPDTFDIVQQWLSSPWFKFILWLFLIPFCYHLVAGIRHLLMDVHVGEELKSGRLAAWITMAVAAALVILVGVWLW